MSLEIITLNNSNFNIYSSTILTLAVPISIMKRSCSTKSSSPSSLTGAEFAQWLVGFIDAEGSFYIRIGVKQIQFRVSIHLHKDDLPCLTLIQERLNIGNIYKYPTSVSWELTSKKDLLKLFDIFKIQPLNTTKVFNFLSFQKAFFYILVEKRIRPLFKSLTSEQKALLWDQIRQIKAKMNTKREKS